jgi:hypothetical protein
MGKNYPTRSAEGSARHAKKRRVRTYPMDHTVKPKKRSR